MMTDADIHYHTPSPLPEDWAETSFFYFYVPEARVYAWVYFVARPAQGAIVADVQVSGDLSMEALGAWYIDIQQHLRMPERFEAFTLSNGLTFKAHNIRDYRLDREGIRKAREDAQDLAWLRIEKSLGESAAAVDLAPWRSGAEPYSAAVLDHVVPKLRERIADLLKRVASLQNAVGP